MMNIIDFRTKLENCWTINTTTRPNEWRTGKRVIGQSATTALLLQDEFDGIIFHAIVTTPDGRKYDHFWNNIGDNNIDVDLTWHQYPSRSTVSEAVIMFREAMLDEPNLKHRYEMLSHAFVHMTVVEKEKALEGQK